MKPVRVFTDELLQPLGDRARVEFISQEKGFGLVAKRAIKEGELIIEAETPFAATLNPGVIGRCGFCWRSSSLFEAVA
jgi:hypothetical protein